MPSRWWRPGFARVGLATVAAAAAVAALAVPAGAVANGEDAPDGSYPFATKLIATDIPRPDGSLDDSGCSGALVDERWVLTAGHCFHDVANRPVSGPVPYPTTAVVGRTDDADTDEGHEVSVVAVRQSPVNDIALVELAEPVTDVDPVELRSTPAHVGETLVLAGWGQTSATSDQQASRLQLGRVEVHSVEKVTASVTGSAPRPDTSACATDSGAPYLTDDADDPELVTVESGGPTCPHALPERTSRADVVADWVDDQIRHDDES